MVKRPLERILGSSLERLVSVETGCAAHDFETARQNRIQTQVFLKTGDGSQVPVQISIRPLSRKVSRDASFGVVVTDMTETRRSQEMLAALSHRL
jgi:hypothetical protein